MRTTRSSSCCYCQLLLPVAPLAAANRPHNRHPIFSSTTPPLAQAGKSALARKDYASAEAAFSRALHAAQAAAPPLAAAAAESTDADANADAGAAGAGVSAAAAAVAAAATAATAAGGDSGALAGGIARDGCAGDMFAEALNRRATARFLLGHTALALEV